MGITTVADVAAAGESGPETVAGLITFHYQQSDHHILYHATEPLVSN